MASLLGTGMPIRRVILYDNGYAIFHREATVVGKGHVDLFFDVGLVQSVLQSLRFGGTASSKVGNIAYEVTKPRANVEISSRNPLADLLKKLKGNQLRLVLCCEDGKREEVIGHVLGVDTDLCTSPNDTHIAPHVTVLTDSTSIRTIPIHQVRSFVILDPRTQQDIEHSLQLTKDDQLVNMQKITVFYSDVASAETLSCQYGFQVKEWKSSYRMMITNNGTKFHLEGLAIVENTLEEDWNGVNITLVVGAPSIASSNSPADHGEWQFQIKDFNGAYFTVRANPKDSVLMVKGKIGRKKGYNPFSFNLMFAGKAIEEGRQLSDYTITNGSTLHLSRKESGELKRKSAQSTELPQFVMSAQHNLSYYQIDLPVTAQRKQQAIVPLLQADLQGQQVLLYDETIRKGSPLSAFLFENTTGRILEGGSIQVSSVDTFLGEGHLPTLHPGDESPPIPFCVDLGVEVVKSSEVYHLPYYFIDIREANIVMSRKKRERTCYVISNKTDKTQDFLLNHFFIDEYELVREDLGNEQEEPVDINDRIYQFRFEVAAKDEKKRFYVVEETTDVTTGAVRDIDQEKLDRLIRKKFIDEPTAAELQKILRLKSELDVLAANIYEKESEVREIKDTQARLRENIDAVESFNKTEASKYVKSLAIEEDRLKSTQNAIKLEKTKRQQKDKELNHLCNDIKFCRNMKEFNNEQ